ncbi:MAG TPA: hypothetical protein VK171_08585 [Fimbriimonas sp.]|nr:hypothetical protein [Fimbriimonas sp.]
MKRSLFFGALAATSMVVAQQQMVTKSPVKNMGTVAPAQTKKMGVVKVPTTSLKVTTKPKLTFAPKALTENGRPNGKPVDPNFVVNLPGKNAKASELVDGTNELEKQLNDLGYSLYTNENDTESPIVPATGAVKGLQNQASSLRAAGGMKGATMPTITRDISKELVTVRSTQSELGPDKSSTKLNPALTGGAQRANVATTVVIPKVVNKKDVLFDKHFGDPEWFAVDFDSSLTRHADMKLRKVTALSNIKATLLGKTVTLFHAKAEAGGNRDLGAAIVPSGPGRRPGLGNNRLSSSSSSSSDGFITLEANLLGDDLFSPVSQSTNSKVKKNIASKSLGWEYSIHIPVIPAVNVVGTIGAKGSMDLNLKAEADSAGGEISVVPSFKTSIYAQAGVEVNLIVAAAEGGLGAELTLIDYEIDISAGVSPSVVNVGDDSYYSAVTPVLVKHSLNTLSGRVYGYAKVSYWLPFKTREKTIWKDDLFKWSGFTDSRTLLSEGTEGVIIGKSPMKLVSISGG